MKLVALLALLTTASACGNSAPAADTTTTGDAGGPLAAPATADPKPSPPAQYNSGK